MTTLTQALLLGTERTATPPPPPHASLETAWQHLDWNSAPEAALLDAAALAGTARCAGAKATPLNTGIDSAPTESRPYPSAAAVAALRRVLAQEWQVLLPEWLDLCAQHHAIVPPFFLRTLFQLATDPADRARVARVSGERGRWLATLNPEWSWLLSAHTAAAPDRAVWETGTPDERLAILAALRTSHPDVARQLVEKTWADDPPDFREKTLSVLLSGLHADDEPFLTRALKDKRKGVRTTAQVLLAALPESRLAQRMRERASALLSCPRALLGRKLEVALPTSFASEWSGDALESKPPTGIGEKAFWVHQILALVPLRHWTASLGLTSSKLIDLAAKSSDWADLLLGAWYQAAHVHRDPEASAALIPVILARNKPVLGRLPAQAAAAELLPHCPSAERCRLAIAHPELAWSALPTLDGQLSDAEARALFAHLAPSLRDGFNPGGSPAAILAARHLPPSLHADAASALSRDNGLSKPAEAFLQALELRAALHDAFNPNRRSP